MRRLQACGGCVTTAWSLGGGDGFVEATETNKCDREMTKTVRNHNITINQKPTIYVPTMVEGGEVFFFLRQ